MNLDELSAQCQSLLRQEDLSGLDELFQRGGSSGGARPKVMTDEWIIKFPAARDMQDAGLMEKEYMDTAAACGIRVPETRLMPSSRCDGYFSVRRFDRMQTPEGLCRLHMLTAAAILEAGNAADREQMYRLMCFNVFAHNQDDHAKNFTWIYDEENDCWHPSPAYDLTWSTTYYGEHSTTVNGNGRNPGLDDLKTVGQTAGMKVKDCLRIAREIQEITRPLEEKYRQTKS